MICKLCEGQASYFGSKICNNNHILHKKCLQNTSTILKSFQDCHSCLLSFLIKHKKSINCILCNEELDKNINSCPCYINLCEICTIKHLEKYHYKKCKICQEMYSRLVIQCEICREIVVKNDAYMLPKCSKHNYCQKCIKVCAAFLPDCPKCSIYFRFLCEYDLEGRNICNLCKEVLESSSLVCNSQHSYCKDCIIILNTFPYAEYPRVNKCESCLEMFKNKQISLENSESSPLAEEYKQNLSPNDLNIRNTSIVEKTENIINSKPVNEFIEIKASDQNIKNNSVHSLEPDNIIMENIQATLKSCNFCPTENAMRFPCTHNYCEVCLINYGKDTILDTLGNILETENPENICSRFYIPCCYSECGRKLSLPFNLFLSELKKNINDECLSYACQLIPYFEGVKFKFIRCQCKFVVGISGTLRLNCHCLEKSTI